MAAEIVVLKRRNLVRGGGAALLLPLILPLALTACGDDQAKKVKGLKIQVQERYGNKDFRNGLELAQKGLALSRKTLGDKAPDTLYFAQAITENQRGLHNNTGTMRALKQELALRGAAGQAEKKLQPRRTMLILLAEQAGDKATAIDQTVIIARSIEMGPGKDPQPTYRPMPDYPPIQYRDGVEGDVDINFGLDANGTPTGARVTTSTPAHVFDAVALESFRKWRFTPFIEDDQPVASSGHHFTLAFRLNRAR